MQTTPLARYFSCISTRCGNSFLQGIQYSAHKSTTTMRPLWAAMAFSSSGHFTDFSVTSVTGGAWPTGFEESERPNRNRAAKGIAKRMLASKKKIGGRSWGEQPAAEHQLFLIWIKYNATA